MSFNTPTARRRGVAPAIPLRYDLRVPGKKPPAFPGNFNAPPRTKPATWPKPSWRPSPVVAKAIQRAGGILSLVDDIAALAPPAPTPETHFYPTRKDGPAPSGIAWTGSKYEFEGYQITVLATSTYKPLYVTYFQSPPFNTWPQVSQSPPSAGNKMHLYPAPPNLQTNLPTVKAWRYPYYVTVLPGTPTDPQFFPTSDPVWVPVPGPVPFFYPNPASPGTRPLPSRTPKPRYRRVPSQQPRAIRGIQADLFPDGSVAIKPITRPGTRPGRGVREKKAYAKGIVALAKLLDAMSESIDFLGVLADAAGISSNSPREQFIRLFVEGGIANLDMKAFVQGFIYNEIEDQIAGRAVARKNKFLREKLNQKITSIPFAIL